MTSREQSITRLYEQHAKTLENAVARRVGNGRNVAEDACAFAWAQLVAHRDIDPDRPDVFAWLLIVATREAWTLLGYRRKADVVSSETVEGFDPPAPVSIEDEVEAREVRAYMEQLPERQREVLTLSALGLSREEIAEVLGWTVRTVDRQLSRARRRVRDLRGEN